MKTSEKNALLSLRIVAIFLVVGGVAGVIVGLMTESAVISQGLAGRTGSAAFLGAATCLFGFTAWTGVELWRRNPQSLIWAQIILIAQIPYIGFPGFAYQFYAALVAGIGVSSQANALINFGLQMGSSLTFRISSDIEGFFFGINLSAVVALYLLGKAQAAMPKQNVEQLSASAQSGI
ncbi:MAG TPA: hypothetical protein VKU42_03080 [Candidatus Angelobacter sp.]|nr:hypothetical protein [Candidatus Angelobacter sp.]